MSATTAPAIDFRDRRDGARGTAPNPSDNSVSLAYKLGTDHGVRGICEPDMLAEHLRSVYLNGWTVGDASRRKQ